MAEFVITKNDSSGDVHTERRYFRYIFNTMTDVIEIEFNTWEYTVCRIPYDDCCLMHLMLTGLKEIINETGGKTK